MISTLFFSGHHSLQVFINYFIYRIESLVWYAIFESFSSNHEIAICIRLILPSVALISFDIVIVHFAIRKCWLLLCIILTVNHTIFIQNTIHKRGLLILATRLLCHINRHVEYGVWGIKVSVFFHRWNTGVASALND